MASLSASASSSGVVVTESCATPQVGLQLLQENGFALEREKMRNGGGVQLGIHDELMTSTPFGEKPLKVISLLASTAAKRAKRSTELCRKKGLFC